MGSLNFFETSLHHHTMLSRDYSTSWNDLDEDLKLAVQIHTKNQADSWRMQWDALNSPESNTAVPSRSKASVGFQAGTFVFRGDNPSLSVRHASDTWDQYDQNLQESLKRRADTQAAFRHSLWEMMVSNEAKECCFFDCCCEGSGYRIAEKKAA